jgi:hypothetical protein
MPRAAPILKAIAFVAPIFSAMIVAGLNFGAAFREEIEIVNRSGAPILVTPIGKWEGSGKRGALPVTASRVIHWPALKNGGFALGAGESIVIDYDGDDIDPSEICIDAGPGRVFEKGVKSRAAADYDFDKDRRIEIGDLAGLPAASAPVTAAALGANRNGWKVGWICFLLFGPLVVSAGLWGLGRVLEREEVSVAALAKLT